MPNATALNGIIERHARGKLEKRWKPSGTSIRSSHSQSSTSQNNTAARKSDDSSAQPDHLTESLSTESSKSRWRSRKFHVPSVASTESQETDETSPPHQGSQRESPTPAPNMDSGARYSRHRLRPTQRKEAILKARHHAPATNNGEVSTPTSISSKTAFAAENNDANNSPLTCSSPVENAAIAVKEEMTSFVERPEEQINQKNQHEFESILRSAHSGRSKTAEIHNRGAPRVRTNGSVTSRWNPNGASSTPRTKSSAPAFSSNTVDKPAWMKEQPIKSISSTTPEPTSKLKPAWVKEKKESLDDSNTPSEAPTSGSKSMVSRWNDSQNSPVGSPFWKTNQSAKLDHDESPAVHSRVADMKSKFQNKPSAFVSPRPLAAKQSNFEPVNASNDNSAPKNPASPEPILSPEPEFAETPELPLEASPLVDEEPPQPETPTTWESPRRRRLRDLAQTVEPASFPVKAKKVEPTRQFSEKKKGNRIANVYQAKINQTREVVEESDHAQAEKATPIRMTDEPPQHQATPAEYVPIETPQKMSVSAMKAKLWGNEEKLIVPPRSPPAVYKPTLPDSPIVTTNRTKYDQSGFQPAPPPAVVMPLPTKPSPRRLPSPRPDPITPPRVKRSLIKDEMPIAAAEESLPPDPVPTEDVPPPQPVSTKPDSSSNSQPVFTSREISSEPAAKPQPKNAWMGRTFKKSVGAALESKIQAIWGQGEANKGETDAASKASVRASHTNERHGSSVPNPGSDNDEERSSDRGKNRQRSPSEGDHRVDCEGAADSSPNLQQTAEKGHATGCDLSPPNSRPTNIPQWRSFDKGDAPLSPMRTDVPSRIPNYSPQNVDSSFTENIDAPPTEGPGETPFTDRLGSPVLSPRSKESYPWHQDSTRLSPDSWQKRKGPSFGFGNFDETAPADQRGQFDSSVSDKHSEDQHSGTVSRHSLTQLAADSFIAVDRKQVMKVISKKGMMSDDSSSEGAEPPSGIAAPAFESDEERSPPIRPRADSGAGGSAIFGLPDSFGSAGGANVEVGLSVAERAKAVASWNGGLGATPPRPSKQESRFDPDFDSRMSPEPNPPPESALQGMKHSVSKRGFGLDDWKEARNEPQSNEFTDPWTPGGTDSFAEQDWPSMKDDQFSMEDAFGSGNERSTPPFDSPVASRELQKNGAANGEPMSLFVLDQKHKDTERKNLKSWRMQKGKSSSPTGATSKARNGLRETTFDPFSDSFGMKSDFTETTEPTDSTDFFGQAPDPFFADLAPPAIGKLSKPTDKQRKKTSAPTKPYIPLVLTKTMSGDRLGPVPSFTELAPPSGSMEEVWSYEAGLRSSRSKSHELETKSVHDADAAMLSESAAEI